MITTFDPVMPKTVPSTYSWDNGIPSPTSSELTDLQVDEEGYLVGYAPFAFVRLSSVSTPEPTDSALTVFRTINFNDYYNCESVLLTSLGFDEAYFCHVYVMPGIYEPAMTTIQYVTSVDTGQQPTIFYQQETIEESQAPVFDLLEQIDRGRIYWNWNKLVCNSPEICDTGVGDLTNNSITWKQASCNEVYSKTWQSVSGNCFESPLVVGPSSASVSKLANKIKIKEISPVAYLSAAQPDSLNRISPLSATLTARFTKCGSFPIEKIVWDLGDGSPQLIQRRWSVNASDPFVYTGVFSSDPNDPRNYDVKHIYTINKNTGFSFYPSITAYASSTSTTDCASTTVGPIKPQTYSLTNNKIKLLQNNVDDQKVFSALLQIGEDITAAKFSNS
jgi:hypothetical protein